MYGALIFIGVTMAISIGFLAGMTFYKYLVDEERKELDK